MNNRIIASEVFERFMLFIHIPTGNLIAVEKTDDKKFNNLRLQYGNDLSLIPDNETIYGYLLTEDEEKFYTVKSLSDRRTEYRINELEAEVVWIILK